jgi:hypothetical protein
MLHDRQMQQLMRTLIDVGSGKIAHAFNGMCPDELEGHDTRDAECPACRALVEAQNYLGHEQRNDCS